MNDYQEVRLRVEPTEEILTDVLASMLADVGFESFVPEPEGLTAYIKAELYDREAINGVIEAFPLEAAITVEESSLVEGRDWNAEWEKNYFKPIVVGDKCVIHSSFHHDVPICQYDIVIDPKMAFGTGHHQTTSLILEQLLAADLSGKSLLDMGTGTGILAILAAMRGATRVVGIEIDPMAFENTLENVALNGHDEITMLNGDAALLKDHKDFDYFVANINRNVITADLPAYAGSLKQGGTMLLSGFYRDDIPVVMAVAEPLGLRQKGFTEKDRWVCLQLEKV